MSTTTFRFLGVTLLILWIIYTFPHEKLQKFAGLAFLTAIGILVLTLVIAWILSASQSFLERRASRKRCLRAFEKLTQWTLSTVIDSENFGYHKQMVADLDNALFHYLSRYPEDRARGKIKRYKAYIRKSYEFEIRKW